MPNTRATSAASYFEVIHMKKRPVPHKHNPLPIKPQPCSLCTFLSTLGPNELQLHMDKEHKGWVEGVIKRMNLHVTE